MYQKPKKSKNKKNKAKGEPVEQEIATLQNSLMDLKNSEMFKKFFEGKKQESNEEILKMISEIKPYNAKISEVNERVNNIINDIDKMCENVLNHDFECLVSTEEQVKSEVQQKPEPKKPEQKMDPEYEKKKDNLINTYKHKIENNKKTINSFESLSKEFPESSVVQRKRAQILMLLQQEVIFNEKLLAMISNWHGEAIFFNFLFLESLELENCSLTGNRLS